MTLPGETVGKGITAIGCTECEEVLYLSVYRSNAGWYLGYRCPKCGPFSRESGYYPNEGEALDAALRGDYGR
jgi:hypothetical protein